MIAETTMDNVLDLPPPEDAPAAEPKDRTAAERQRRHRAKHKKRDAEQTANVTHDAVTVDAEQTQTVTPAVTVDQDFDWAAAEANGDVVCREQRTIAVYINPNGDLVIREQRWPDDDVWIVISTNNTQEFLDRICDLLGIGGWKP